MRSSSGVSSAHAVGPTSAPRQANHARKQRKKANWMAKATSREIRVATGTARRGK